MSQWKDVLLIDGPAAGQCIQIAKQWEEYTVEVAPKHAEGMSDAMLRAQTEAKRVRYMISPFPLHTATGSPLYIGLTDHRFLFNPIPAVLAAYEKATLRIKQLEKEIDE